MADPSISDAPPPTPAQSDIHDYGSMIQVSMWVLAVGSGVLLWVRVYCKIIKRLMWWDDWLLILSWILLLLNVAMVHESVVLGFGRPAIVQPPPTPDVMVFAAKVGLIGATFAIAATGISKTSFAVTMIRLTSGNTRKLIWAILFSINLFMGIAGMFLWIECIPLEKSWDPVVPGACWDSKINPIYARFASIWSGTMDLVLAMLPWKILWNLKLQRREKFGVAVAMSLGIFAGMTAYIKMSRMNIDPRASGFSSYTGYTLTIWASAEPAVTIAAASIPVLRVLFNDQVKKAKTADKILSEPSTQQSEQRQSKTGECIVSHDQEKVFSSPVDEEHGLGKTWFDSSTLDNP